MLSDRIAIVTGGASGIGRAIVHRFAREGAHVIAIDRDAAQLSETATASALIEAAAADVTDHGAIERIVGEAAARYGRIDILVNNAGFSYYVRHDASTLDQWRATQSVNAEAAYWLAKLVTPIMARRHYGRIVNVTSIQAYTPDVEVTAYAASKGALDAWTRALAVDLAPSGILVNAIAPGCIHTSMCVIDGEDMTQSADFQEWYVRRRKIPLGRPGTAEEIAGAAVFLAGDECTYVTGHTLVVDGGLSTTH